MCGVMGFVRTKGWTKDTTRFLTALMIGIEIRGDHAAGVAYIPRLNSTKICYGKKACPASQFISGPSWTQAMDLKSEALIGHARWATHGSVNNPINNHPHVSKNRRFALVHNGIVAEDIKGISIEGQCDSEKILALLQKGGVQMAMDKLGSTSYASYAVLALDAKHQILHAFRNARSPMVVSDMSDTIGGIVFCSTLEILEDALSSCEMKDQPKIHTVIPDVDFTFPIPCKQGIEHLKLPVATYTTTYTYKSGTGYVGGYTNTHGVTKYTPPRPNYTEKERRERWRLLSNDETPLDFVLKRTGKDGVEKVYKTWKEYFKDYPPATQPELTSSDGKDLRDLAERMDAYGCD